MAHPSFYGTQHLVMYSMDVWTYWEGSQPPIVKRCIERTKSMYGGRFHLFSRWPEEYGPEPECDLNFKACLLRYELLYRHGGHYLDADCIVFRDLDILHGDRDLTTLRDRGHMCDNGYIGVSEPMHPIVDQWRKWAWERYHTNQLTHYTALGKHVLVNNPGNPLPSNQAIMPIHWRDCRQFHRIRSPEEHLLHFDNQAFCYMLTRATTKQPMPPRSFLAWLFTQPWYL